MVGEAHTCQNTYVEIREQHCEVGSPFPLCKNQIQVVRLEQMLYQLSHLNLQLLFLSNVFPSH